MHLTIYHSEPTKHNFRRIALTLLEEYWEYLELIIIILYALIFCTNIQVLLFCSIFLILEEEILKYAILKQWSNHFTRWYLIIMTVMIAFYFDYYLIMQLNLLYPLEFQSHSHFIMYLHYHYLNLFNLHKKSAAMQYNYDNL